MPGYAPFLLCDFRVHTRWSDGRMSVREVVDLYGRTGQFDVIAIADSVAARQFGDYLDEVREEAARASREFGMLVIPAAEVTPNRLRGRRQAPIIALGIEHYIHSGQPAANIRAAIRQQDALELGHGADHADIRRPGHHYSWKTLLRAEPSWPSVRQALLHDSNVALTLVRSETCAA